MLLSKYDIFFYMKNLAFKPIFLQINLNLRVCVKIQNIYFFKLHLKNWHQMLVFKLSGIQKYLHSQFSKLLYWTEISMIPIRRVYHRIIIPFTLKKARIGCMSTHTIIMIGLVYWIKKWVYIWEAYKEKGVRKYFCILY